MASSEPLFRDLLHEHPIDTDGSVGEWIDSNLDDSEFCDWLLTVARQPFEDVKSLRYEHGGGAFAAGRIVRIR